MWLLTRGSWTRAWHLFRSRFQWRNWQKRCGRWLINRHNHSWYESCRSKWSLCTGCRHWPYQDGRPLPPCKFKQFFPTDLSTLTQDRRYENEIHSSLYSHGPGTGIFLDGRHGRCLEQPKTSSWFTPRWPKIRQSKRIPRRWPFLSKIQAQSAL